jgi:ATP-dependent DNA helicase RecG
LSANPTNSAALAQSVEVLRGVSPARQEQLARLGITTIGDLLFHIPRAYENLTDIRPIAGLTAGTTQTVRGEVVEIDGRRLPDGRSIVSVVLSDDGKHCLEGIWFNQPYMGSRYRYGQWLAFSGKPQWYHDRRQDRACWRMSNPRVQVLGGTAGTPTPAILPIYPLTEDLRADQLRSLIRRAVEQYAKHAVEILPAELRARHRWPELPQALRDLHLPETMPAAQTARRRLIYEEFLLLQLALALRRRDLRDRQRAPVLTTTPLIDARIRRLFPFQLTADQNRAVADVCRDLASDRPMQRLLQADVGAGKTVVAVYALLTTVANKHQAVLMAPTEVLARQHQRTLDRYLAHSRVRRLLLTSALTPRQRREALADIREGRVDLVVGTQALVQEDVQFARLGLVVIDEQHKFGVHQRARVRKLGVDPHYLVMTATPIPRTVALTVFGDLDTSIMRELPPGRQPVVTRCLALAQRKEVYERLRAEVRQGKQGFIVCPLVEGSPTREWRAAEETYEELRQGIFRDLRLGLLHGRMDEPVKDEVMERFRRHELDLLVATTVIEVGVDVPNATLIVVEQADRFGLSQLHQLRGRVSRGTEAGQCYLLADPASDEAKQRLRALTRTTDGFALAEMDARLRGLGEFFGTRQHGLGELKLGDLIADRDLLQLARKDAFALVAADAGLRAPELSLLRRMVLQRYGRTLELAEIG